MGDYTNTLQTRFEKFAMRVEELTQQGKKWIDVDAVGAEFGLSDLDSRQLAEFMAFSGWVTYHPTPFPGSPKIMLTKKGLDEVARLRWPFHQKWIERYPRVWNAIAWAMATCGGVILGDLVRRLL